MTRKICVITGTRAEYGLLRLVIQGVRDDRQLELQLIAAGMHLSPEFGFTYQSIERDGFHINRKIEMLLSSDTAIGVGKSVGLGVIGFVDAFADLKPDLVLVLGDRFEILAAVTAAMTMCIPVMHLHGGELTEGSLDESMRHAITKMSHVHCVATEVYRQRVIQLGEQPERVYCVGGLGVDVLRQTRLMDRTELENSIGFKFKEKNLLVTFHPSTLTTEAVENEMNQLLGALDELGDTGLIFTLPNADSGGRKVIAMLQAFISTRPNARAYQSLGQQRYLSCMALCDGVIGNSSSALLEAPSLKKGAINIGDRQRGRLQAGNVINCRAVQSEIKGALQRLYSSEFNVDLARISNPYGEGGGSASVIAIIKSLELNRLLEKPFYDLPASIDRSHGVVA